MKLVDLLIKHNVQWPEGATSVWQGQSLTLYWAWANRHSPISTNLPELSDRVGNGYRCTKEGYDSALAKHKAKWIRNRGVKRAPCLPGRDIEVRFRCGGVCPSPEWDVNNLFWHHKGSDADIMAWRYV